MFVSFLRFLSTQILNYSRLRLTSKNMPIKIAHKWTIKKFGYLCFEDGTTRLSAIQSDNFTESGSTFFLRLNPNEIDKHSNKKFVTISLHLKESDNTNSELAVSCKLSIIKRGKQEDYQANKCKTIEKNEIINFEKEIIFNKFISHDELIPLENGFLPQEKFTVYCEIAEIGQNNNENECESHVEESESVTNAEVEVTRLTHNWRIQQFSKFREYSAKNELSLSSKDLAHPKENHSKFFLRLWPNGRDCSDFISIYLYLLTNIKKKHQSKITAQYEISLVNANEEMCYTKLNREQIIGGNEFGCHKYVSLKELLNKSNGLLSEDILNIFCKVDLIGDEVNLKPVVTKSVDRLSSNTISKLNDSTNISITDSNNLWLNMAGNENNTRNVTFRAYRN